MAARRSLIETGNSLFDIPLNRLEGRADSLATYRGNVLLAVNVASRCGKTPQYAALQALQNRYADRGLTVLGFPCNQFGREEAGTASEIAEFCSLNYGVTFPMFSKLKVNGRDRHPLYRILCATPDDAGIAGGVTWNFEKFLIARDGRIARRFRPATTPDDPGVLAAIEALLAE